MSPFYIRLRKAIMPSTVQEFKRSVLLDQSDVLRWICCPRQNLQKCTAGHSLADNMQNRLSIVFQKAAGQIGLIVFSPGLEGRWGGARFQHCAW